MHPTVAYEIAKARRALSLLGADGRAVHRRPLATCQPLTPCAGCA